MEKYFREVLGEENLYIVDPMNPPLNYPSPNELKKKFVIKCKRKRIFGNFEVSTWNFNKKSTGSDITQYNQINYFKENHLLFFYRACFNQLRMFPKYSLNLKTQ